MVKGYNGEFRRVSTKAENDIVDLRHGFGVYQYDNPVFKYTGHWKNGRKHGEGTFEAGNSVYEGSFRDGQICGFGKKTWMNGDVYTGKFVDGEMEGNGEMVSADGSKYNGEWRLSYRSGQGHLRLKNGDEYIGGFSNHQFEGKGRYQFAGDANHFYDGDWIGGKRTGVGEESRLDGAVYRGRFVDDIWSGHGRLSTAQGFLYDGEWMNGQRASIPSVMDLSPDEPLAFKEVLPEPEEQGDRITPEPDEAQKKKKAKAGKSKAGKKKKDAKADVEEVDPNAPPEPAPEYRMVVLEMDVKDVVHMFICVRDKEGHLLSQESGRIVAVSIKENSESPPKPSEDYAPISFRVPEDDNDDNEPAFADDAAAEAEDVAAEETHSSGPNVEEEDAEQEPLEPDVPAPVNRIEVVLESGVAEFTVQFRSNSLPGDYVLSFEDTTPELVLPNSQEPMERIASISKKITLSNLAPE